MESTQPLTRRTLDGSSGRHTLTMKPEISVRALPLKFIGVYIEDKVTYKCPTSAYTGWHHTILLVNFVPQFMVVRPATVTSHRFLCTLQRLGKDHSSLEAQKFGTHWTLILKNINR